MKPEEAKTALMYGKYIALDTESTGFQPNDNFSFLLEIGAVKVIAGRIVDRFDELINPGIKIPKKIQELTGITDEMVENKSNYIEVLDKFRKWCDTDNFILLMHNAPHDLKFLNYFGEKCGITFDDPFIDTQPLAKNILKNGYWKKINSRVNENYKLATLANLFGIQDLNHHRADNDAELTYEVFSKLKQAAFKKDPYLMTAQLWKYPQKLEGEYIPQKRKIKIISICPWDKKKRIYVNISTLENNEQIFATIFYDFDYKTWGIKNSGFPINTFREIEDKIKQEINKEELKYEHFDKKIYLKSCFLVLNNECAN